MQFTFTQGLMGYLIFLIGSKVDILMISYLGNLEDVGIYGVALFPLNQFNAILQ